MPTGELIHIPPVQSHDEIFKHLVFNKITCSIFLKKETSISYI